MSGELADFAALVPKITGSISAVSSGTIIFLIYRSEAKLSTIYHRIMFGMSFADVFASSAMALTTLPMPRNDDPVWFQIERWTDGGIKWEDQTKLGNIQTCEAQAFFYSTCVTIMFAYNGMLCIYYACAIAFRMRDEKIRKKVEPFIHIVPLCAGLAPAIPSFLYGYYGPIDNEAWCTMRPGSRTKEDAVSAFFAIQLPISICVLFFVILASFGAIFWRVRKNGKELRRAETKIDGDQSQIVKLAQAAHRNSKLIIVQSFAYAAAFLLTLVFPLIRTVMWINDGDSQYSQTYALLGKLMLTFMPLQGFLNFIIFLSHKGKHSIYNSSELILFVHLRLTHVSINAPFISCELPHRTPQCVCMPSYQTPFWKLFFRTSIIFEAVNGSHEREYARG